MFRDVRFRRYRIPRSGCRPRQIHSRLVWGIYICHLRRAGMPGRVNPRLRADESLPKGDDIDFPDIKTDSFTSLTLPTA